jgi:hypothetical protein
MEKNYKGEWVWRSKFSVAVNIITAEDTEKMTRGWWNGSRGSKDLQI